MAFTFPRLKGFLILQILIAGFLGCKQNGDPARRVRPVEVPQLWNERALADWATPVAGLGARPSFVSPSEYYAAPEDNLRTWPVYHPDREPAGYRESLVRGGPRRLIEPENLLTNEDWIDAGRRVFEQLDDPRTRTDDPEVLLHFTNAKAVDRYRDPAHDVVSSDGVLLDYRWVVDRDGKLKLSLSSCAGCHTRLMPDGSVLAGAPSNFDLSEAPAVGILLKNVRRSQKLSKGELFYLEYGVPWRKDDVHLPYKSMTDEEIDKARSQPTGEPPGTMFARFGGSPFFPTRMADLRGIRNRKYLDATATHRNRGPEDVARYGILVEYAEERAFGPHTILQGETAKVSVRPPDAAMYAMALYLYSLEPPPGPHPMDETAQRGKVIFNEKGCANCHTPPIYTNNRLVAVDGFEPPREDPRTAELDLSDRRVHTDPDLALKTRKGTGYYKIPSLRGLWYRGLYGHSGFVNSLEDWFDKRRLRDDFAPTGFHRPGAPRHAVPGHEFGLKLDANDKNALIAFLRTL